MMIKNFLKSIGKKLFITDSVSGVNKLIRAYSADETIYGVKVVTINQLATEMFLSYAAIYEPDKHYEVIDNNMQFMRLTSLLNKMEISFLTEQTKTISSATEILYILNQIRYSIPSEWFLNPDKNNKRIIDLKHILDEYEKLLKTNYELDGVMVLQEAIKLLHMAIEKPNASVYLGILSSDLSAKYIGGLFVDELSDLEKQFISLFTEILNNQYVELEVHKQNNPTFDFFKAYGIANEVKQIKGTILDEKIPYGDVTVIYPNEAYEHFIMSEFDEVGIKYTFPRGFRAVASDYVSFMIDLLDFAASDFEYKRLYKILQNPVLQIKKSRTAYRAFLKEGIGYGRDRYLSFFKYYDALSPDEKIKNQEYEAFYQFLVEVIECFEPNNSCEAMFRKLVKIAGTYTDNKDLYRACVKDELNDFENALAIWEGNDFSEKLFQMEAFLKKLKCRTSEMANSVSVIPYGKTEIIDRKCVFVVGLSNENISAPNSESPVLCDDELKFCTAGKVQLAMERNKRKKNALINTLNLSMEQRVYCSYSYFDTVSIISNSPSILFQELLQKAGVEEREIPCFGYTICKDSFVLTNPANVIIQKQEEKAQQEDAQIHDVNECTNFSASSLQSLIHCPLSFYYEKIRGIPQICFQERTPDSWLPANIKGNVFHHVMEKYVTEVIIQQGEKTTDETVLMRFFNAEIESCKQSNPISSQATYETEKEECMKVLKRYIAELHQELNNTKNKKIIGCEVDFTDISYIGKNDVEGAIWGDYELLLRGSVDRLDGVMDDEGTLLLQIYDYKTGSLSKKEEEIANGNQIQHHIYAIAMERWANEHRQELEHLFGQEIKEIAFDDVRYIFPYEEEKREILAVCQFDENGKPVLPEETHKILLCIVANYQNGKQEDAIKISSDFAKKLAEQDEKHCRYCNYIDVCRAKA